MDVKLNTLSSQLNSQKSLSEWVAKLESTIPSQTLRIERKMIDLEEKIDKFGLQVVGVNEKISKCYNTCYTFHLMMKIFLF